MRAIPRLSPSSLALAVALAWPAAASAQRSFQADGQVVFGSATIGQTNGTVVRVASPQTVINWTPGGTGDPTLFQPAGTTALFTTQSGSGLTDFAVLNRILPADPGRAVQLNGTILSRLEGSAGQAAGTVFFYSPGGIVVGSNAVIDVGSLGLTTSDPWSGSGAWLGTDRTVRFATSLPSRIVTLAPGSSITSSGSTGSYTAIVAPQVLHRGTIRTSGGAALVAADSATITFSPDNLYTIQVGAVSPDDPGGLTVDGGTIGRAAAGPIAAAQRLYLVSIPKNIAMTMVIQGGADLGFTPAGSASIDGDAIVLSAGQDIERGALGQASNGFAGNAFIDGATFRDRTEVAVSGAANLLALDQDLSFAGDLTITSSAVILRAEGGHALSVGGSLLADARQFGRADNRTGFGGTIDLVAGKAGSAGGGSVTIGGSTTLLADGVASTGGSGIGGTINLLANAGGALRIGGDLFASADGLGGDGAAGGVGRGGAIRIAAQGGTLSLQNASLRSDGAGGAGLAGAGGEARSGAITLEADGGGLLTGSTRLRADARGGAGAGGPGGDATIGGAGGLSVLASAGGSIFADSIDAAATASGGTSAGGTGRSLSAGGNRIQLAGGELRSGHLRLAIAAQGDSADATRDLVSIDRATATVAEDFSLVTTGQLGVVSNGGRLSAGSIALGARTFVAEDTPAEAGSIEGGRWTLATSGDLVIGAGLTSGSDFIVSAPGRVQLSGLSSANDTLIKAGGALAVGDVAAGGRLLLASGGALTSGRLSAAGSLALLGRGTITTRGIAVPGGTILIGHDGMTSLGGSLGQFNWAALLGAAPARTGGDLLVQGPVAAASMAAAVGGDARFTGAVEGSGRLGVDVAGLLSLEGGWTAPTIELTSRDIALGSGASLSAATALRLTSSNPLQIQIGDGLSGSGYGLSNAEFARLHGETISLTGRGDASAPQAIQLGRLALAGGQLGSAGTLRIATVGGTGVIGVLGAFTGTGLGNAQTVELEAARIEVDGLTGSINLAGSGSTPAGQLSLRTDRLWAADPAILGRLAANPAYVGRERDLAQPSATPHPEGIIRAGTVRLFDARQILVQNSGTRSRPAGITTSNGAFLAFTSSGVPIELIANGQIIGPNGTTTAGFAVQTALTGTQGFRELLFTANSSINGCLVSAPNCNPANAIRDEDINLGFIGGLPDKLFGDDEDGDDGKKGKASTIAPAERLVNRRPLDHGQPVDEPVSGAGNPALSGDPVTAGGQR